MALCIAIEGFGQAVCREYLVGCAGGEGSIGSDQMHGGEIVVNQMKVVDGGEDGNAFGVQTVQKVNELGLPADVEVLSGFVKQQKFCLLCEAEGDLDALT